MKKITVSKFPKDPGPAAWNAILPQAGDIRRLEQNVTAEWVVIGGGYAGLAAARRLKQMRPDDRIVVLEALRVGEGPAGRNSGFMIDLPHDISSDSYAGKAEQDKMQTAMNRAAIGFAAETAAEYGIGPEAYDPIGKINAAATEKGDLHNREYAEHLASMDEPHELLDAEQMRAATGIDYYTGGLFTPGTVMLQPARFIRAVGEGLVRQSVDLFEHSAVVELNRVQQDWQVRTQHGSVTAPNIILAVNGHAQSFGFYKQRFMHVFTYASMTKAHRHNPTVFGVTPADPMGTTVRRFVTDEGERIVIRNRFTYDPSMEVSDRRIAAVGRDHDKAFAARFPELKGLEMEYRWGGRLCLSRNNVQAFGEVEEGIFSACCQNGLGTSKGTLAGMLAVELATRSNNPMVAEMLKMEAPSKLPPEPLSWIGANATIRWKELKAGREL